MHYSSCSAGESKPFRKPFQTLFYSIFLKLSKLLNRLLVISTMITITTLFTLSGQWPGQNTVIFEIPRTRNMFDRSPLQQVPEKSMKLLQKQNCWTTSCTVNYQPLQLYTITFYWEEGLLSESFILRFTYHVLGKNACHRPICSCPRSSPFNSMYFEKSSLTSIIILTNLQFAQCLCTNMNFHTNKYIYSIMLCTIFLTCAWNNWWPVSCQIAAEEHNGFLVAPKTGTCWSATIAVLENIRKLTRPAGHVKPATVRESAHDRLISSISILPLHILL